MTAQTANAEQEPKRYFGRIIPFLDLLGIEARAIARDSATVFLPHRPALANLTGHLHGGMLMTVLDFAMSAAARSGEGEGIAVATIDMTTSFIGGADADLTVEATCLKRGRSIAFCEARATTSDGRLIAKASGTFSLRRPPADTAG